MSVKPFIIIMSGTNSAASICHMKIMPEIKFAFITLCTPRSERLLLIQCGLRQSILVADCPRR